jgi:hypothetical protein
MSKPVSVDFRFSIKQRGRGGKKRIFEGAAQSGESKPALERIPRISRYMALAIHFEDLIRQGVVSDYADLARLGHVTRARVTQIMNLRLLTPEIQEELLFLDGSADRSVTIKLNWLQTLSTDFNWLNQLERWRLVVSS